MLSSVLSSEPRGAGEHRDHACLRQNFAKSLRRIKNWPQKIEELEKKVPSSTTVKFNAVFDAIRAS